MDKGSGLLCWGFYGGSGRGSVGRGQHSSNWVCGISTKTMHKSTTPSLSQTRWARWASRQFLSFPIVQTLLTVTSQRLSLWDIWGDERRCEEGHWYAHTRGLLWGLPEVLETLQQVYFCQGRLLQRGLEFHVCTINKSAHKNKKSQETYLFILVHNPHLEDDLKYLLHEILLISYIWWFH